MKKIFILLFLCLITFSFAEDIQVKVSIKAESNSLEAEEELETEAKKAAIKKHIKKLDSQVPSTLIEKAVKEYSNFIDDIDNLSGQTLLRFTEQISFHRLQKVQKSPLLF